MMHTRSILLVALLCGLVAELPAEQKWSAEQLEHFEKHVRPVLVNHCVACHGPEDANAGLRLDSRVAILNGGESGPTIDLKQPEKSLLLKALRYDSLELQMPPEGKLKEQDLAHIAAWVKAKAPWPAEEVAETTKRVSPASEEGIETARREHWAFQPVQATQPPSVRQTDWPQTPVDHFILAKLEAAGLTPGPDADKATLLRRAKYDLHGLPPTQEEMEEFLNDSAPDAFAKLVDRLLAEPEYGQRWGRHWLDIARYADSKGYVFQEERSYPFAYTYRDYVIRSFNEDKPYNQFILEQLAADQLDLPEKDEALAAMGFLTVGRRFLNNTHDIIDDRIDVTMRGLQGMTVACARCHDHKYDPIPTADYYSLYGVFNSSYEPEQLPLIGEPQETPGYLAYQAELKKRQAKVDEYLRNTHREMQRDVLHRVGDYLLAVHDFQTAEPQPNPRNFCQGRKLIQRTFDRWRRRLDKLQMERDSIFGLWHQLAQLPADNFEAQAKQLLAELKPQAERYHPRVWQRLNEPPPKSLKEVSQRYNQLFAQIEQKVQKQQLDPQEEELRAAVYGPTAPTHIDPNEVRSLLQRDQRNKLRGFEKQVDRLRATNPHAPARGMVMYDKDRPVEPRIFRRGNPNNPGERIPRKFLTVLDPEAKPFQQGSGRLELARRIASEDNPLTARVMVNRVWMHHFGEGLVRTPSDFGTRGDKPTHPELLDSLTTQFIASGWSVKALHRQMMLSRVYQQSSAIRRACEVKDPENRLLWRMNRRRLGFEATRDALLAVAGELDTSVGGRPVDILKQPFPKRRTVYAMIERQNLPGVFRMFDFASPDTSTPQRHTTTVPQQALFLMNHPFVIQQAKQFLSRPEVAEAQQPAEKIRRMYQLAFAREPSAAEIALGLRFVQQSPEPAVDTLQSVWQYGYAKFDQQTGAISDFQLLPHWSSSAWQGGPKLPDGKLGWAMLNAHGGHPGNDHSLAVVRRWRAKQATTIAITGKLAHRNDQGDGVRGVILSDRQGKLGDWTVHHKQSPTEVAKLEVQAGETIDFIVDCRANPSYDSFSWAPILKQQQPGGAIWSAADQFHGNGQPSHGDLSPWEQYAQVLLLSNEFVFID